MSGLRPIVLLVFIGSCAFSHSQFWEGFRFARATIKPPKGRIIGGDEVEPNSIPFQVGLRINGNSFCSGSLITPNYVLTAAHCAEVISSVQVILGAHNITDDNETTRTTIRGAQVIIHEDYNGDIFTNDIALIQLAQTTELNDYIQLAQLPTSDDIDKNYENLTVVASGWGLVEDVPFPSINDMSPVLKALKVSVDSLSECMNYYYDPDDDINYITKTNICTSGYKALGTCSGDSGGPLTLDSVLIGLTSFGTVECQACSPSVYTRIVNYLEWISENSDYVAPVKS